MIEDARIFLLDLNPSRGRGKELQGILESSFNFDTRLEEKPAEASVASCCSSEHLGMISGFNPDVIFRAAREYGLMTGVETNVIIITMAYTMKMILKKRNSVAGVVTGNITKMEEFFLVLLVLNLDFLEVLKLYLLTALCIKYARML